MYFSRIVTAGLVLLSNAAFAVAQADLTQAQVDTIVASLKNITSLTRDLKLKSSEINPTTDLIGYAPQALPVPLPLPSLPVASKYKDVQDMLNSAGSIAVGFANSVPSGAINNAANVQAVKDELVALYFEIIAMICTLTDKACRFSVVPAAGENIKSAINNYSNGIGVSVPTCATLTGLLACNASTNAVC